MFALRNPSITNCTRYFHHTLRIRFKSSSRTAARSTMGRRACGSSPNCALPVFGFSPRRLPGQAFLVNFKRLKYSERVAMLARSKRLVPMNHSMLNFESRSIYLDADAASGNRPPFRATAACGNAQEIHRTGCRYCGRIGPGRAYWARVRFSRAEAWWWRSLA
jgi:hypothetical protein